jgi:hypothetical protein
MGNWNYKSRELVKHLDKDTIRKGGVQQITAPTLTCGLANEHESLSVSFGGDKILVNYNIWREQQSRIDRFNKKMRALNRNIKQKGLRQSGLTHRVHYQGAEGGHKS